MPDEKMQLDRARCLVGNHPGPRDTMIPLATLIDVQHIGILMGLQVLKHMPLRLLLLTIIPTK